MKTFIRVIEIWIPDRSRTVLELGSGLYGSLTEFKTDSEYEHFAYGEGLPGKAWATGHPIVMTHFEPSHFKRTLAAQKAGLTCGIALPIFSGDFLLAVVVFFCGDDDQHAGAIEVWRNCAKMNDQLTILDGYYGSLDYFENISRAIAMPKGEGIPGIVWEREMPILIQNIAETVDFRRSVDALAAGITTGLGIPAGIHDNKIYIVTFLSAKATPIAKRIQIWIPQGNQLICETGYSKTNNELASMFETIRIEKGSGALGRVWLTGMPIITGDIESAHYNAELDDLSSMLAIPVIQDGHLTAIVTFLF
jgi:hypothetical protein